MEDAAIWQQRYRELATATRALIGEMNTGLWLWPLAGFVVGVSLTFWVCASFMQ